MSCISFSPISRNAFACSVATSAISKRPMIVVRSYSSDSILRSSVAVAVVSVSKQVGQSVDFDIDATDFFLRGLQFHFNWNRVSVIAGLTQY